METPTPDAQKFPRLFAALIGAFFILFLVVVGWATYESFPRARPLILETASGNAPTVAPSMAEYLHVCMIALFALLFACWFAAVGFLWFRSHYLNEKVSLSIRQLTAIFGVIVGVVSGFGIAIPKEPLRYGQQIYFGPTAPPDEGDPPPLIAPKASDDSPD